VSEVSDYDPINRASRELMAANGSAHVRATFLIRILRVQKNADVGWLMQRARLNALNPATE